MKRISAEKEKLLQQILSLENEIEALQEINFDPHVIDLKKKELKKLKDEVRER
jgi:hypothetical protein